MSHPRTRKGFTEAEAELLGIEHTPSPQSPPRRRALSILAGLGVLIGALFLGGQVATWASGGEFWTSWSSGSAELTWTTARAPSVAGPTAANVFGTTGDPQPFSQVLTINPGQFTIGRSDVELTGRVEVQYVKSSVQDWTGANEVVLTSCSGSCSTTLKGLEANTGYKARVRFELRPKTS